MDISDIEAFLAIVDTRSLSKAASVLFVTQSTVSYRLMRLEKELGVELISRKKGVRYVELTAKGLEFVATAQQWTYLWKQTQQFRAITRYLSLRIAQVDWFIAYPFNAFYQALLDAEPLMKLDIRTGHSLPISSMVRNSLIDIGFVVHPEISTQISCKPLFRDPLVLVCSQDSPIARTSVHPRDLDVQNEVFWKYYGDLRIWHDQWWDSSIIPRVQIDFAVPLSFSFLSDPKLWLVSPRSIAEEQARQNPNLRVCEFSVPPPDIVCYCVQRKLPDQQAMASVQVLMSFLESHRDILIRAPYMQI